MKKLSSGTSIVEAIIVTLIVSLGIIGAYSIYNTSSRLALTTENRIEAIQIAREGIEAFTNIRDTNWYLFTADIKNCWNTYNYNNSCIGDISTTTDIASGSYLLYQETSNRWHLFTGALNGPSDYSNPNYRNLYKVKVDTGTLLYTQSGGEDFLPTFTREIIINYINTTGATIDSNDEKMEIKSVVQWGDSSSKEPHKIELKTILTNWKNKD